MFMLWVSPQVHLHEHCNAAVKMNVSLPVTLSAALHHHLLHAYNSNPRATRPI